MSKVWYIDWNYCIRRMVIKKGQTGSNKPREKRVEVARNSKPQKGKDHVVDEEMEEDDEERSVSGDDSEESVFEGDEYEDVEEEEFEDELDEDDEFEDEFSQRKVKLEEEEDLEEEDGEYMDGDEDEEEDVVVRVQKRGKTLKEVGLNALKKKAHLQMMQKRRREEYDDVEEGRRPVKKTLLLR
ncbi:uncharacterized protein [Spinacia oleracea]|uniref:Spt6 acidic N-terminal domain-containing protein n=1 Tax=Spinacia oleracea TaxID=3562 RepID=A0A9R0INH4_SPIOL|nr:uncharacterized protein LOC110792145 [Spinacia oleracea]